MTVFGADLHFAGIYLFSSRDLRVPSADRREILHDARKCVRFYNPGRKILGGSPEKNFRGQKPAKFGPNLDDFKVRRRISPEWIYSKSDK